MEIFYDPLPTTLLAASEPNMAEHPATAELADMDGLFKTYRARIYRYALLSLRDEDLADSIAHDCLLKAFHARGQFRGDCSVATWLTRIATNLIRDQVRSRKMQFWKAAQYTAVDAGDIADRLRSPGLNPEGSLLVKEQVRYLWATVEKLSAKQRSVFLLRFVEELDLSEIAVAMGMNVGTVKSHLHRALSAVRSTMEKKTK
jgi:RNA polymerase sigma-70 factor (ECF subfamily)